MRKTPSQVLFSSLLISLALAGCWADIEPDPVVSNGEPVAQEDYQPGTERVADYEPAPPTLRRLTRAQYRGLVRSVFGDDIILPEALEPDVASAGYIAVGAGLSSISSRGVEQYENAAYDIVEQLFETRTRRQRYVECEPAGTIDDECASQTIARLGLRLWRRPLSEDELTQLVGIAAVAADTLDNFYEGLGFAIAALLQSPNMVYRIEIGEPSTDDDGVSHYNGYELASRLSFFLWNTAPDAELLEAAANGDLDTREGLMQHAERMLASENAREGVANFFNE
ncbi:MAG: DUF1592 domain-containing protein, partial [Myxococcales bacterium]|nr:DUF1592 domain-containing protein [Myxococcales bacterium]